MKTSIFLIVVLISGAFAGLIHGTVNFAIVEPYLDQAIGIENQNLFESGEEEDTPEFWVEYEGYRTWQKGGQILAGVILGTSVGALFGIVFALSRNVLPGNNDVKKSLILAGIMWFTLFIIPFLKYPANPPTVGDGETVVLRAILYLSFIAISGFAAVGFYQLSKKFKNNKKLVALLGYGIFISAVFFAMPENPDEITAPMDLVNEFRFMSVLGVTSFWASIGIILGLFWRKLSPQRETTPYS
ncbi:putative cobalt transporter subunit protein [Marine Group I thaumarchaeote SCGC AAA799-B03]|uniref:Putative cobalt transporter subunit protein n=1 Tax=Marine Group I thaumarchaeote SCGC AAA799-B03 TaxID=1502289 RepID=A0A087S7U5_9ARCH|nr:putative cobalt transporter subunit protein [Marine Group I thaumarchaeote SCGC AAA799-B03]